MSEVVFRSDVTVELVRSNASDQDVLFAARVSTQGEQSLEAATANKDAEADSRDRGLINYLMRDRHGSPFEHNSMTFYVQAPIFVFREFMRHRIASYNEESGRYKELSPVFYIPGPDRNLVQTHFPSFPQREIEMCAEKMEDFWAKLMPFTYETFNQNGRVAP